MMRRLAVLGILLALCAGGGAQAEPPEGAALTLHVFYSPSCPICLQTLALLNEELLPKYPDVRLEAYRKTDEGWKEQLDKIRGETELGAEAWGASIATFEGAAWQTRAGREIIQETHRLLGERLSITPSEYREAGQEMMIGARRVYSNLEEFTELGVAEVMGMGLRDAFQPAALVVLLLGAALVSWRAQRGPVLAAALGGCLGYFLIQLLAGSDLLQLGYMKSGHFWLSRGVFAVAALFGLGWGGLLWLELAGRRRRAPQGEAESAPAEMVAAPRARPGSQVLAGLLLGLLLGWMELGLTGHPHLPVLGSIWRLGHFHSWVLTLAALHAAMIMLPLLVVALAGGLGEVSERAARWGAARRQLLGAVHFLVCVGAAAYLLYVASELMNRALPGGGT